MVARDRDLQRLLCALEAEAQPGTHHEACPCCGGEVEDVAAHLGARHLYAKRVA